MTKEQIKKAYRLTLLRRGELTQRKHLQPNQFSECESEELKELNMLLEFHADTHEQTEEEREAKFFIRKTYEALQEYDKKYPGKVKKQPIRFLFDFSLQYDKTFPVSVTDKLCIVMEMNREPSCMTDILFLQEVAKNIHSQSIPHRQETPFVWITSMHKIGRIKSDRAILYVNIDTQLTSDSKMP